jgi:hypothetical protein
VKEFITKQAAQFKNFEVKYKQGQIPQLIMTKSGEESETISIVDWNLDRIVQFLNENLQQ